MERSYGIIPLRRLKNGWQTLLVHHLKGHWAFPKGHAEHGETPLKTAKRELNEETGLSVKVVLCFDPLLEHYSYQKGAIQIEKTVLYYIAEVEGEIVLQTEELKEVRWASLEEAEKLATFSETKALIKKLDPDNLDNLAAQAR